MKDNYTHITLVVDRSGSMRTTAVEAQGGINRFVKEQQEFPGQASFYLADFDDRHADVFGPEDIKNFKSNYTLEPRGMTALLDAFGKGIVRTGTYLADMAEADRPSKVLFALVTDGGENSSHEYTQEQVRSMVKEQTDTYGWEFVFIGANIDAFGVGGGLGVTNSAQYMNTDASVGSTYSAFSANTTAYRGAGPQARMAPMASTDVDGNIVDDKDGKKRAKEASDAKVTSST